MCKDGPLRRATGKDGTRHCPPKLPIFFEDLQESNSIHFLKEYSFHCLFRDVVFCNQAAVHTQKVWDQSAQ